MLLQRKNGYVGLPTPFSRSSGTGSPGLSTKDPRSLTRNHQSLASAALEWRNMDQLLSPAKGVANGTPGSLESSCLRRPEREFGGESPKHLHRTWSSSPQRSSHFKESGIGLRTNVESSGGPSRLTLGRWHSLSRLPSCDSGALDPTQASARRRRSVSEQDLRASLAERVQREAELATLLKETGQMPKGEMEELKKLEVDLNVMKFELLSLKQRMESSFAVLEKEKTWLETMPSGDRKRKGKRKETICTLKMELLKAKSYLGRRKDGWLSQDSSQREEMGKRDVSQDMPALQETLAAQEYCTKVLDKEREAMAHQLKSAREERDTLHHRVEKLPLGLECSWKKSEGSLVQGTALHPDLVGAKSQVSREDQEKVLLKRELESTRQGNKELSLEVAASRQNLETSLESLRHLEADKLTLESRIQALENERAQLLRDSEGKTPQRQLDGPSQEEELQALQVTCENLRESQSLLQREKDVSEIRCLELEAALRGQQEEMQKHLAEQKQVSQYWQDRWEQVAAALKTKEEEMDRMPLQSHASSAQLDTPLLLRIPLGACEQDLELEQNHSQALQHPVQHRDSGSQTDAVPTREVSADVDREVALIREELRKVWDMLKARETELEEKQLELESTRSQYVECSSEKQRLDQLVASLGDQLAEKQQALRRLEEAEDEDRTKREMKISLLERKLAEMGAVQNLQGLGSNGALETREVRENVPGEDGRCRGTCRHCSTALAQLNQAIQSAIKREKEDQTLTCLYQVQDLLKGCVSDQAAVPTLGQSTSTSTSQDPSARVTRSPQQEREILRQQHHLVTEQLKGIFRQRQQMEQSKKQAGGSKEERLQEPWKSPEVLAAPKFTGPLEGRSAAPDVPSSSAEVQSLQQLLKEKMETISSMASEIQALQQKNESLMKAKLRFQQQIQQIRNLPKQRPERSAPERLVPRLLASLGQDLQSAQGSDSSIPSPQSDEPPFTGSREDLSQALQVSHHPTGAEDQRRGSSSDEGAGQMPLAPPSPPGPPVPPPKSFSLKVIPVLQADSEVALLSPRGSSLLSPRPFGPPRPWSPFRFKGNPELPEDGEKH